MKRSLALFTIVVFLAGLFLVTGCARKAVKPEGKAVKEEVEKAMPEETIPEDRVGEGAGLEEDAVEGAAVGEEVAPAEEVTPAEEEAMVTGIEDVFFDYDRYSIREDARATLEKNVKILLNGKKDARIVIEGHCDERGTVEYNIALGQRRADAVKKYLVDLGVDPSRITTVSYGKEKPFCFEHNEQCWQENRRAHFVISE